ncbi:MAG: hypothetical protein Kow0099_30080 [Candidatus Abyssubacteria bacterium]
MEARVRLFLGFSDVQTGHVHPMTGTPIEVPDPMRIIFIRCCPTRNVVSFVLLSCFFPHADPVSRGPSDGGRVACYAASDAVPLELQAGSLR